MHLQKMHSTTVMLGRQSIVSIGHVVDKPRVKEAIETAASINLYAGPKLQTGVQLQPWHIDPWCWHLNWIVLPATWFLKFP